MCRRYGQWSRRQWIEELLGIEPSGLDDFPALYNITPGVSTWVVRAKDGKPALHSCLSARARMEITKLLERGNSYTGRFSGIAIKQLISLDSSLWHGCCLLRRSTSQ
jgi:hypothetical protein